MISLIIILVLNNFFDFGTSSIRDFSTCHDDFELKPPDGILKEHTFSWLGFAQYAHVTTGQIHQTMAPRVVLIHKQFAIGTAQDIMHLPKHYELSYIIFNDYERDEKDCGLTMKQLNMGLLCPRVYVKEEFVDVTPHPEYLRFGTENSLVLVRLLRPMKSQYVLPLCLPSIVERKKKKKSRFVFMVDYLTGVPKNLDSERLGKKTLRLYTHKECSRHRTMKKLGNISITHYLCTSGCGIRAGAPIVSHAINGAFELIGIAAGGGPCTHSSMRNRLNDNPPVFIDIYPYNSWIINLVTAKLMPRPFPYHFRLTDSGSSIGINEHGYLRTQKQEKAEWRGRTYVVGNDCFKNKESEEQSMFFYAEKFMVVTDPSARVHVHMKISAGIECTVTCARLQLPNQGVTPEIKGIGGYNISIDFSTDWFPYTFYFSLGLTGKNSTEKDFQEWLSQQKTGFWTDILPRPF